MILIKNVEVYAPEYKGKKDVFISGEKISLIQDEINFENIGNKKTCVFVVTSDTNSAFDFLSTLFFSFLLIKLR